MAMYNKEESKVKLVITLPGQTTETWYSIPKEDKISIAKAVRGLKLRILNKKHRNIFAKAIFYNVKDNTEIEVIKNELPKDYDKNKSKIHLVIYQKNGKKQTFYSFLSADFVSQIASIHKLEQMYIANRTDIQTAIMYNNRNAGGNGKAIHKWINKVKQF